MMYAKNETPTKAIVPVFPITAYKKFLHISPTPPPQAKLLGCINIEAVTLIKGKPKSMYFTFFATEKIR